MDNKEGVIVVGQVRWMAARQNGWTEAPVHVAANLTSAQVRAYRLMDNRSHDETTWDEHLLAPELAELQALDLDLSLTGFGMQEIDALLLSPNDRCDETPALPDEAITRSGDLWLCGPHRVLCGDAISERDVRRLLGERKPSLLVTDPPYGISLDSEWRDRAGINKHGPAVENAVIVEIADRNTIYPVGHLVNYGALKCPVPVPQRHGDAVPVAQHQVANAVTVQFGSDELRGVLDQKGIRS